MATLRTPATLLLLAAAVLTVVAAVLLHQHARGRLALAHEQRRLDASQMRAEEGHCATVDLGIDWMSGHARPSPARLLENGRELGPGNALHDAIRQQGQGRFSFWHGTLYFSSSDGSDPTRNGRTYEIVWPVPVADRWRWSLDAAAVALSLLAWFLVRANFGARIAVWTDTALRPRLDRAHARWIGPDGHALWRACATVAVVALLVRVAVWIAVVRDPAGFISGNLVMGVPFSDASGWDSLGESAMRGDGLTGSWSARRPFYAWALGALYVWTGPSPLAAVYANTVLGALTAGLVCRIGQRLFTPALGLLAGLAFAFDPVGIEYSRYVLTETLGTFLFVLSVHQVVAALQSERGGAPRVDVWAGLWAGVCFALSNLTRTLTLLGLPLFALALLWLGWRRSGWRRGLLLATAFAVGAAVPLGGWIARQKIVHDLATISDNTASGLYAAASPALRTWSAQVDREADLAGIPNEIKARYDWCMRRFREELAAHPGFYWRNAAASAQDALRGLALPPRAVPVLLAAWFLLRWLRLRPDHGRPRAGLVWWLLWVAGIAFLADLPTATVLPLAALGIAHALWRRPDRLAVLPLLAVLSTVLAMGLFALGSDHRLLLMTSWVVPYGLGESLLALSAALGGALGCALASPDSAAPAPMAVPRAGIWLRRACLLWLGAGFLVVVWRHAVAPLPPVPWMPPPTAEAARAVAARVAAERSDLVASAEIDDGDRWFAPPARPSDREVNHGRLVCAHVRLDRHRFAIPAGLKVDHWSRIFVSRDYDRTFSYGTTLLPGGAFGPVCLLFAAPPPHEADRDLLVFGRADVDQRFVYEEVWLEVLAWAPLRPDSRADLDRLAITTSAAHAALVAALGR